MELSESTRQINFKGVFLKAPLNRGFFNRKLMPNFRVYQFLYFLMRLSFCFLLSLLIFSSNTYAQVLGCTDPLATNYNSLANVNNGTCVYPNTTMNAELLTELPSVMNGTSGLLKWNDKIWTQNNFSDNKLYAFQPGSLPAYQSNTLSGYTNIDWEEIAQDDQYLYIAEFGNNVSGNRRDLKFYRVLKNSLLNPPIIGDTIRFSYSTQTDFTPLGVNQTNYDAEAFIVTSDSLYIFTKEWSSQKTSLFRIPKTPGTHSATLQGVLDVQGLITGAVYLPSYRLVLLSGYSTQLQPFVYLLYDFKQRDFFGGNKRKINLNIPFHQVEAITDESPLEYLITNERFSQFGVTIPPRLHRLNLSSYLSSYVQSSSTSEMNPATISRIYPNPASNEITIDYTGIFSENYTITDISGVVRQSGMLKTGANKILLSALSPGIYIFSYGGSDRRQVKIIRQ